MEGFRSTIHGALFMQDRHRRLFSAMRISAMGSGVTVGQQSIPLSIPNIVLFITFQQA